MRLIVDEKTAPRASGRFPRRSTVFVKGGETPGPFSNGSDSEQKLIGIQAKCKEFINLEYPPGILKFMCVRLYHQTGHTVWLIAKGTI